MGKTAAAPKVCGRRMDFYEIRSFDEVSPGFRGIPEPTATDDKSPFCPENALVIMPGAVFDRQRHRIGYGGGYYDRFLSEHPDMTKLAAAFDFQVLDQIPVHEYDISADLIVTERQIYR
jgi:5-formyltetrahydrofolate cyclo-ligase